MLAETTITMARAIDLEEGDVVLIDATWRLLMDVARSQQDVLDVYSSGPDKTDYGMYPEMARAYEALGQHWDQDYVILRYAVQEKSTPAEVEDAVKVVDAMTLMDVQVRVPRKGIEVRKPCEICGQVEHDDETTCSGRYTDA